MPLAIGTQLGSVEITALLGRGGMGEVYRARDRKLKREVAIKVLPDEFSSDSDRASRFQREAEVLAALNHPYIAAIYDLQEDANTRYLVLELVEGETLAERVARGPIPLEEALRIAKHIAEAVWAAHEKGIVHRDLKPANVKITPDGTVKVLDFGLAKAMESTPANPALSNSPTLLSNLGATNAGIVIGTAGYMSPEQARGKPVDKRADIWAFGVVLYEIVTGKQLFGGETVTDTLAAVIEREPDLKVLPPSVRPLIQSCLRKDPKQRLHDISDARLLLEYAPAAEPQVQAPVIGRRRIWLWPAATALFLLATSALGFIHFREKAPLPVGPTRFQIATPALAAGVDFYMAMSPDGRKLAYTALGPNGLNQLWIRSMDSLESKVLSGTEAAVSLFWSPDSRFIGFGQVNRLKKVDASGAAPPVTLCEIGGPVGMASWSPDDVIIFGGRGLGPLRRVAASGGTPSEVTVLGKEEINHTFPVFLPDRHHFIYLRISANPDIRGIYIGSLDVKPQDQPSKRLLGGQLGAFYIPASDLGIGRLLFVRDSTLLAQPFDTTRLELTGEPVPITEEVGSAGSGGYFAASAGSMAYRSGGAYGGQLTWYDRSGTVIGKPGTPAAYMDLALSPDGSRVATFQDNAQRDIWLLDLTRSANTRFTFDARADRYPAWSPDGTQIAFTSGATRIYRKASDGSGAAELLLDSPEAKAVQDWSHDGRYLLYSVNNSSTLPDLFILPLQGERKPAPFLVTPFTEIQARFSADGRWVAYVSDESGRPEIYVRPFAAPENTASAGGKWMISNGGGVQPRWRADGKEIVYLSSMGRLMSVEVSAIGISLQASLPKPLFDPHSAGGGTYNNPVAVWDMSRDGQRFLVNTIGENTSTPITVVLNWQAILRK